MSTFSAALPEASGSHRISTNPARRQPRHGLYAALHPAIGMLAVATVGEVIAGVLLLLGSWGLVHLLGNYTSGLLAFTVSCWLVAAFVTAAAAHLSHTAEARVEDRVRRAVASRLVRIPAQRLTHYPTDSLRRLVSEDISALHHLIAHFPGEIATLLVIPMVSVLFLIVEAGPVALVALIPGAIAAVIHVTVIPRISKRFGQERARVMGRITTAVSDYARGIHVLRTLGTQQGALADYHQATRQFTTDMIAWVKHAATPAALSGALLQAATTYALAYWVSGTRSAPVLAATVLFSLALVTPALRLGHGLDYVSAGRAAAARIAALLDEPELPSGTASAPVKPVTVYAREVTVEMDGRRILDNLTLVASAGSLTAITGPSGIGKSTLLCVLAGMTTLQSGIVEFEPVTREPPRRVPISTLSEDARTATVFLVPQSLRVLDATVRENLLLTRPDASDHQLTKALRRAHLDVALEADASVFSGGERQRLALARAFLSSAPVLICDEPTSALDAAHGEALWDELLACAHADGRTVIVVTHDLAFARIADHHIELMTTSSPAQELDA